ncbi:MAG: hypothetical protein MZV63_16995 [Marinilabiliales bacterium]|nr:hypothetical protein [Marinilabiliales bacterium]
MLFRDHFCDFPDKAFFIDTLYFDAGKKPDRFLILPFCFDDPFTIFRHQVDGIRAICAVDLDGTVIIQETNHIIARDRAAAAGQDVFDLCNFIAQHQGFRLYPSAFPQSCPKGFYY